MADFTPIGNTVAPIQQPNIYGNLNSILGLAQAKQGLAVQAQQLQQETLKTKQQQGFSDFTDSFDPASHIGPDGTLDVAGIRNSAEYKGAGLAKPLIDDYIQKVQSGQLQNKQALQTLDNATLGQMSTGVGALANDPDVKADNAAGRQKVTDFYRTFAQQSPEAARIAGLYGTVTTHAKQGDLADAVYSQQLMGADVLGQRAQQNPGQTTNAAGQIVNVDRRSGALSFAPPASGAPAAPGAAPPVNPTSATAAANVKTAAGTADNDVTRAKAISDSVAPSRQVISLTTQLDNYVDESRTGKFSKAVTDYAAAAGIKDPAIAARQLASKTAAQIRALATTNAPTNEARETISAGSPDPDTMGAAAVHGANELVRGNMRMNLARAANSAQFQTTHGGTQGLQLADDQLTKNADGLMYEYQSLPKGPARTQFIQRHFSDPGQASEWVRRKNLVEHNGGFAE